MVIFHSYVSLPEGTFNFYKIINLLWRETLFFQKGISETVFFLNMLVVLVHSTVIIHLFTITKTITIIITYFPVLL